MPRRLRAQTIVALAAALLATTAAQAIVFELGEAKGSFDTTLSVGALHRLKDPDPQFYGYTNSFNGVAGEQRSVNADDGNLNYGKGLASFLFKANHDLQIDYRQFGLFARGFYFYDHENMQGTRERTPLSSEAKKIVGEGGELLDAYVYMKADLGNMPARLAIGKQVLSWGESTFIPNGINSVNPIDVAKLRLPGAELKEALRPINMVSFSLGLTDNINLEGFYLLDWERTRVDPPGTYFSTNDFVAKGGTKVMLGFGALPDTGTLGAITRGPDNEPEESGQWGIALRYMAAGINNTEFALYFMNYHSRLPVISARTPTTPITPTMVNTSLQGLLIANAGVPPANAPATANALLTLYATNPAALTAQQAALIAGAQQVAFLTAAATGRYNLLADRDYVSATVKYSF